jgi:hypothetical protein
MEPFGTRLQIECQCRDPLTAPAAVCKLCFSTAAIAAKIQIRLGLLPYVALAELHTSLCTIRL